jgi:hypothetical protein
MINDTYALDYLRPDNPPTNLPPLWEVIYQEAIRGNHLLFHRIIADQSAVIPQLDTVEEVVLSLLGCTDLQAMVHIIDQLTDNQYIGLYHLYRHVLRMWAGYSKDRLS